MWNWMVPKMVIEFIDERIYNIKFWKRGGQMSQGNNKWAIDGILDEKNLFWKWCINAVDTYWMNSNFLPQNFLSPSNHYHL